MDINELFLACRRGDLTRVEYLTEQKEVELNVRDKWDSTPLYYACLCGYTELVKYLLDHGAKCEANTFDGERCLYGALKDEIRTILKTYKAVTASTMRRDDYSEFLRRLFEREVYCDINFIVHGERVHAHRCVLAARSEYFENRIKHKWKGRSTISLNHSLISPFAFKALLQYLYTGRVEVHVDQMEDLLRLAKHCRLFNLVKSLMDRMKRVLSFESTKPGVNVTMISLEPPIGSGDLQDDLGVLADHALPEAFGNQAGVINLLPFPPEQVNTFADIIFSAEGHHFKCHKAFFCGRSDYFKALIADHFGENSFSDLDVPIITIHEISAGVFSQVMFYVYQDICEINSDNVYDILFAADMYLLPGLKRLCANTIGQLLEIDNIVHMLRTARLFNLPRLEDQCAEFIASNIEKVTQLDEFGQFVREDASGVNERQETDSIPIVDDIRFYITNFVQTFSDMYEADQKLSLIDSFLEQLELDA